MSQRVFRVFLTFVVVISFTFSTLSYAKPDRSTPEKISELKKRISEPKNSEGSSADEASQSVDLSGLKIVPAPEPQDFSEYSEQFSRVHYFHGYKKALTLRAGAVLGFKDSSDDPDSTNGLLGFSFLLPRKRSPQIEVSADLAFVGYGHLSIFSRHIFHERSSFRPYYRYGVMNKVDPNDRLATFSNLDNYLARFGFGFENSSQRARSYRVEVEIAAGAQDVLGFLTLGRVFSL